MNSQNIHRIFSLLLPRIMLFKQHFPSNTNQTILVDSKPHPKIAKLLKQHEFPSHLSQYIHKFHFVPEVSIMWLVCVSA